VGNVEVEQKRANMSIPQTTSQWILKPRKGSGFDGLEYQQSAPIAPIGPHDCLVRFEAASLNYRDVAILQGNYPWAVKENVVPVSDGAGTVIAVGEEVSEFEVGDKVCTLFHQGWQKGLLTPELRGTTLGTYLNGVLRPYAVFPESGLVPAPEHLSTIEASTLPCAAVTAWNALYGLEGRALQKNQAVLVQGTGGVSLFALQFALAAGAMVIATTSSAEKAERLKALGAHHVINYKDDSNWGETARKLSPGGAGVHHVIEVGGSSSMQQSLKAIRIEGLFSLIGFLGGKDETSPCNFGDCLATLSIVRGVNVGSKEQFLAMNNFMAAHQIRPVVDETIFPLEEAKGAYEFLWGQKQWGKVVIKLLP
jgi:NADPH:quinone reductase-like Zn-dependent oxidoreductase